MHHYKIQLRPCDAFYFGGERSFGEGDAANYLVYSRYFPQQTTLVGLMRYLILITKGYDLSYSKLLDDQAAKYIGSKSFEIGKYEFGILKRLGPVGVSLNDKLYFPDAKNHRREYDTTGRLTYTDKFRSKEVGENYTAKELLPADGVLQMPGNDVTESIDNVFQEVTQTGNQKMQGSTDPQAEKEKDGLYKMTRYRFNDRWCFEFLVELGEDIFADEKEFIVPMGGEHSHFYLTATKVNDYWKTPEFKKDHKLATIVLLTDAYVEKSIDKVSKTTKTLYDFCEFAISEIVDFRFFKTETDETTAYNDLSEKTESLTKSSKYNLLERGSVFYIKKDNFTAFRKFLDNACFQNIGYNQYQINLPK